MTVTKGTAKALSSCSVYENHLEIINEVVTNNPGITNPSQALQYIIDTYANKKKEIVKNFLVYILYPFAIIILMLLYSVAIENVPLSIVGGASASIFWYLVFRYTCLMQGVKPGMQWSQEKRKKVTLIVAAVIIVVIVIIGSLIWYALNNPYILV